MISRLDPMIGRYSSSIRRLWRVAAEDWTAKGDEEEAW